MVKRMSEERHVTYQGITDPAKLQGTLEMLDILIPEWYGEHNNEAGGALHIITDDGNLTDGNIDFCRTYLNEDMDHPLPIHTVFGNLLLDLYQSLSGAQRVLHAELKQNSLREPEYSAEFIELAAAFAGMNCIFKEGVHDCTYDAIDVDGKRHDLPVFESDRETRATTWRSP